jgi:hypothetical protein
VPESGGGGEPFELHRRYSTAAGSPDDAGNAHELAGTRRVGLDGVLADRGNTAHRSRVPGDASYGFRWRLRDQWSQTWWPQGISVGSHGEIPIVMTSWYAQARRGVEQGARITIVDLRNERRPRYHHVLLVARNDEKNAHGPVTVHAGGIVWSGDRLLVAATFGGIREFRLSDILEATGDARLFGYRLLLPEHASFEAPPKRKRRMRYSFLSLESAASDDDLRLVSGEYSKEDGGRLFRIALADGRTIADEEHIPGIPHMQGAVVRDGRWFVSASRGDKRNGDLWIGTPDAMVRHEGALAPGPEDLALLERTNQLWSVSEYPGKRWVFALDLDLLP